MRTNRLTKRKNIQMCLNCKNQYTYSNMKKQYVEGLHDRKKNYLIRVGKIWVYHSLAESETMYLLFKDQRQKEIEKCFLKLLCDTLQGPTLTNNVFITERTKPKKSKNWFPRLLYWGYKLCKRDN